jgi:aminotransferase
MARTSRLAGRFAESVIRRSTVWSVQHGAINLAQGFPDDEAPREVTRRAIEAIAGGRNQYSDTWGTADLRQAVADRMNRDHGLGVDGAGQVTVTCGATEAMAAALLATVDPGDEVIVLEPSYENFRPQCLIAGARPVAVPLAGPRFDLDRDRLSDAFSGRTAAILLNNPNNPCGKVFSRDDLQFVAGLCARHDAVAISDEVYEHMVYDGLRHHCLASIEGLEGRWIVVSSCSKTFHVTGWRIGYAVSDPERTRGIRRCHDFLTGMAATPLQDACVAALGLGEAYYAWLLEHYTRKRLLLVDALNEVGLDCSAPEGAYYVLADMGRFDFEDSVAFCQYLMATIGVAAVPWPSFYSDRGLGKTRLRFTFSKSEETIRSAVERLRRLAEAPRES